MIWTLILLPLLAALAAVLIRPDRVRRALLVATAAAHAALTALCWIARWRWGTTIWPRDTTPG